MASGIWTTRDSNQAQTKVLEKSYVAAADRQPPEYTQDINVIQTDKRRSQATFLPMAGIGTLEQKFEGQAPAYDSPQELIPYTATFFTMALAVKCTEEGELEDPENVTGKIPGMLARSSRLSKDLQFYQLYNLAFSSNVLGTDGQPLCSQSHPLGPVATPTGIVNQYGTFSNSLGATALSPESLEQAKILFKTMLDERGLPDVRSYSKIVVPEQMDKLAREITGSDKVPFSNDNTTNVQKNVVSVRTVRYLTSSTAWFLQGPNGDPFSYGDNHQLFVAFKWDNKYKAWSDSETGNYNQKTSYRCTFGFGGWRSIVGSQGSAGNV